jgi:hypothetical protein
VACDVSTAVERSNVGSAYLRPSLALLRALFCDDDEDRLDERLRVPVLARADGAWLGMGAGLARAENISSLSSRLTRPGVSATAYASCVPRTPACASAAASCAWSTISSSAGLTPAVTPPR